MKISHIAWPKFLILPALAASLSLAAVPAVSAGEEPPAHGPNFSVDSADLEPFGEIERQEDDRLTFYSDGDMAIGINEDSEPSVGWSY